MGGRPPRDIIDNEKIKNIILEDENILYNSLFE